MTSADFATDIAAAVGFLRTRADIDRAAIGLIGHSEGVWWRRSPRPETTRSASSS